MRRYQERTWGEERYFTSITFKLEMDDFSTATLFTPDGRFMPRTSKKKKKAQVCQPTSRGVKQGHPGHCPEHYRWRGHPQA